MFILINGDFVSCLGKSRISLVALITTIAATCIQSPVSYRQIRKCYKNLIRVFYTALTRTAAQSLVIAGLGDLQRPVESLSIPQSASLAATGLIWSRYSLVIIPKNHSLFAVNVFVAITSLYQIGRAIKYEQNKKKEE